jgi:hypothetical protein
MSQLIMVSRISLKALPTRASGVRIPITRYTLVLSCMWTRTTPHFAAWCAPSIPWPRSPPSSRSAYIICCDFVSVAGFVLQILSALTVSVYSCFEKIVSGQDRSSCKFPFNNTLVRKRSWMAPLKAVAVLTGAEGVTGVVFFKQSHEGRCFVFELQKHSLLTKFSYRMFNESLDWTWVLLLNRVETILWDTQKEMGHRLVSLHSTVMWSPP